MPTTMEIQLERMDGKLEKHIGITETILKNQESTLGEIRDIVKDHADKFITEDEVKLRLQVAVAEAAEKADGQLEGFEKRIDKKYAVILGTVTTVIGVIFAFIKLIPMINTGA